MRKKTLSLTLLVGATFLLAATGVLAASPGVSNPHPVPDDPTPTVANPVAAMIALFFGLDPAQVQEWHDEGIGYGNMTTALFFAEASELTFDEIIAMRGEEEGGGWGYIIKRALGLEDFSSSNTNLGAIMSGRATSVLEQPEGDSGDEVESASTKGPPHEPKGWQQGKGNGLGRGQNKGHAKGHSRGKGHDK